MKQFLLLAACLLLALPCPGQGNEVVVVYNSRLPESKQVADYYARRRGVPANQVLGLDLPTGEAMTRENFIEGFQQPLLKRLEDGKLFIFSPATNQLAGVPAVIKPFRRVIASRVRYAVLCYGVPVKILRDERLVEPGAEKLAPELRRNEAAVDSQLAMLPVSEWGFPWTGPLANPFHAATNVSRFNPVDGLLMVARLDGPSAAIARGLVDKAIAAETNGLRGRAYFDARGLTNGGYAQGDDWIRGGAREARRMGFETVLDNQPATFTAGFPMSQIALYAGWYDQQVSGPFTRPTVEFMPGAFAYHLYSFSAQTIRASNATWVATLLQKGAACSMGAVNEPYLSGTPNIEVFLQDFLNRSWSFGEAAYASQAVLSWQTTVVGDPLYRPALWSMKEMEQRNIDPGKNQGGQSEWLLLAMLVNREARRGSMTEALELVERSPITRQSAVLTEKLGDIYLAQTNLADAIDMYEAALTRGPSPMQRLRLLLSLAEKRTLNGPDDKALGWYETILKEYPDYPEPLRLYQQMLPLARRLGRTNVVDRCEKEIRRLSSGAADAPRRQ